MDINNSDIIDNICKYIKELYQRFNNFLSNSKIDFNSIIFELFLNFVSLAAPLLSSSKIKHELTSEISKNILKKFHEETKKFDENLIVILYYLMIYTNAISNLINGGDTYQCEIDYSWLIKTNYEKYNIRENFKMIKNDDLKGENKFKELENFDNFIEVRTNEKIYQFIQDESNEFFRNNFPNLLIINNPWIKKLLISVILHQTNLFDKFQNEISNNKITEEMRDIIKWVTSESSQYNKLKQKNEIDKDINKDINKVKQLIYNMILLIELNPAFDLIKNPGNLGYYLENIKLFIWNNDPMLFLDVLKILPQRINDIIYGLKNFEYIFAESKNFLFLKFVINGIAKTNSYQRLDYLLSIKRFNDEESSILAGFIHTLNDSVHDINFFTSLEALFTILSTCKSLSELANETLSDLKKNINENAPMLYTSIGLSININKILEEIYDKKQYKTFSTMNIKFSDEAYANCDSKILDKIFDINDWHLNKTLINIIFGILKNKNLILNDYLHKIKDKDPKMIKFYYVSPSFSSIIKGFRSLLNQSIQVKQDVFKKSSIKDIIFSFAIIAADLTEHEDLFAFRNEEGNWLFAKQFILKCVKVPFTPYNQPVPLADTNIYETIQEEELNLENALSFDEICSFWDVCMNTNNKYLNKLYILTLIRYINEGKADINKIKDLSKIIQDAKPFTNYYTYYFKEHILKTIINQKKLESSERMARIDQNNWCHLFPIDVTKYKSFALNISWYGKGYIILRNKSLIYVQIPSGVICGTENNIKIHESTLKYESTLNIKYESQLKYIYINDHKFYADKNTIIEFIIDSYDHFKFKFTSKEINEGNQETNENSNQINFVNDQNINREEYNSLYCSVANDLKIDFTKQFGFSTNVIPILQNYIESEMCNQLKSVLIALLIIYNNEYVNETINLSFIRSAVVSLIDNPIIKIDKFSYNLDLGFFKHCSERILQNKYFQIIFLATNKLIKSKEFMDSLGNELVKMAGDYKYQNLYYKSDLIYVSNKELNNYKEKESDYVIQFTDSKGIIEMDKSGNWIINTPIEFLFLLWIFIENCSTSEQRINAKLALIDCWIMNSPMIKEFLPDFLSYMEKKLDFTPNDFNQTYFEHLEYLSMKNPNNLQIKLFFEIEKERKTNKNNYFDVIKENVKSKLHTQYSNILFNIIHLMRHYDNLENFPNQFFDSIYEYIIKNKKYKLCKEDEYPYKIINNQVKITNRTKSDVLLRVTFNNSNDIKEITEYTLGPNTKIKVSYDSTKTKNIHITAFKILDYKEKDLNKENCRENFAIKWEDQHTNEFLSHISSFNFMKEDFNSFKFNAFEMKKLINEFGIITVQCKAVCIYLINYLFVKLHNKEIVNNEMLRIIKENSHLIQYENRKFDIFQIKESGPILMGFLRNKIVFDANKAMDYEKGKSNNIKDSMIYQFSKTIKHYEIRYQFPTWVIRFTNEPVFDTGGATRQTVMMAANSFINLKTGLCIKSPNNFEENNLDIIPFSTKFNKDIENMYYGFGIILGSMIRMSSPQIIHFPNFVWKYLAGKPITKDDIYENDTRLKDKIEDMKNNDEETYYWKYDDWNGISKPIDGLPSDKPIEKEFIELYERIVINLRIKSIEKCLKIIRNGFWMNQKIDSNEKISFMSGGLLKNLCYAELIDKEKVINNLRFTKRNEKLEKLFIEILNGFDQEMLRNFFIFTAAQPSQPSYIDVEFEDNNDKLPHASTCTNTIYVPIYETKEEMEEKLKYAITHGIEMNIEGDEHPQRSV